LGVRLRSGRGRGALGVISGASRRIAQNGVCRIEGQNAPIVGAETARVIRPVLPQEGPVGRPYITTWSDVGETPRTS
jgi:hypothetical protein